MTFCIKKLAEEPDILKASFTQNKGSRDHLLNDHRRHNKGTPGKTPTENPTPHIESKVAE